MLLASKLPESAYPSRGVAVSSALTIKYPDEAGRSNMYTAGSPFCVCIEKLSFIEVPDFEGIFNALLPCTRLNACSGVSGAASNASVVADMIASDVILFI